MANSSGTHNDWVVKKLSDVLVLHYGKALKKEDRRDGPFPVFGSSGVVGAHDVSLAKGPGVIVGRKGNVGSVFWSDRDFFVIDTAYYVTSSLPLRFLYYLLPTLNFINGDAAVPGLSRNQAYSLDVRIPPLPIQQRIAGILSAYDDQIENSQRRIKILEEMARSLYREWFVNFRYPGHESVPLVSSPLGEIPQGWEGRRLFDLTKVGYGKNLPTKKLSDDGAYPVYGAAKIIGRYTEYTRENRTIICGCRGSVGEMQITQRQCYVTNNSFTFDPLHQYDFFWLFHTLKERGLRDVVGGAAQPQITLEGISSVELVTPPSLLRNQFQEVVTAIFEQIWVLDDQVENLRRTRDLLLPRLLSGQIDVEAMAA